MTDPTVSSLTNSLSLLSAELVAGLAVAGSVLLLRFLHKDEFPVWNVTFNLRRAWIILLLFTAAHLYLAGLVIDDAEAAGEKSPEVRQDAWNQINGGSSFLLHGMHGRTVWIDSSFLGIRFRKLHIEPDDKTKLLHYGCALLLFCACVNWRRYSPEPSAGIVRQVSRMFLQILPTLLLGLLIVLANWSIATRWVYAVSQLAPAD